MRKGMRTICPWLYVLPKKAEVIHTTFVESMKATYEHDGKIYNFCCPMCIDDFKRNPEKYAAKAAGNIYDQLLLK